MKKILTTLGLGIAAAMTLSSCASLTGGTADQAGADMMGGNGSWIIIVIYVAIFAGIYFLLIRPNSKKKKQEQKMRDSIQIGDDITTIGGIMGKIVSVKDESDSFVLETGADRVRMQFKKWAISTVDTEKETISVNGKKEKE